MLRAIIGSVCCFLASCTSIDYTKAPPPDWPDLTVVEHYGVRPRDYCETSPLVLVLACMRPDFERAECNLYFGAWSRSDLDDWLYEHELAHCKGYDHPDDDELRQAWENYKRGRGLTDPDS